MNRTARSDDVLARLHVVRWIRPELLPIVAALAAEQHRSGVAGDVATWSAGVCGEAGGLRMLDVDGERAADAVTAALHRAEDALVDGGILFSADTFDPSRPGVWDGTNRFLREQSRVVPFGIGFNKLMSSTAPFVARYQAALRDVADQRLYRAAPAQLLGFPVVVLSSRSTPSRLRLVG